MDLGEIIKDSLYYPLNNIVSLLIYAILAIIVCIVVGGSFATMVLAIDAGKVVETLASGFIGFVVAIFVGFIISGYSLDIIKYGIERRTESPGFDILRQFFNGVKLLVVSLIYYVVPLIITALFALFFNDWVISIISLVLFVIFGLAQFMAQCRLARSEDLVDALAIGEAIGDISRVGFVRLLIFIIVIFLIVFVLLFVSALILTWNTVVGGIIMGIVSVYVIFFTSRATGLLYSDV